MCAPLGFTGCEPLVCPAEAEAGKKTAYFSVVLLNLPSERLRGRSGGQDS